MKQPAFFVKLDIDESIFTLFYVTIGVLRIPIIFITSIYSEKVEQHYQKAKEYVWDWRWVETEHILPNDGKSSVP
jgi:hypothetical protein